MAKIRKLYDEAIKPDGTKQVIYPITSTRAVYTTSNITVDAVLGEGYRFGGVVGPTDSPSFLDQRVFYAASIPGVYTNFGGISVNGGEAVFLIYDGISWSKGVFGGAGYSNLSGFVVLDSISELPREKTTLGYLIADESLPVGFSKEILYVWVGEHGDTLGGLYQNCGQLRGASAYEVAVWNGYEGTQEEWLNDPVNGIKGISVQSFEIEGEYNPAESAVNTYKVTLSNGDSLEMPIKNGSGIKQIEAETISYENGGISTYKITLSDNREYTFQVRNGKTSCGLFGTAEALAEKYPSPEVGDYAFVGSAFPALIYVCNTAGEWTNTEETYDGDNVDLTEYAKSEDVGYYIQNPEYVRVYTDAEDKILWGIKADGTIYFGAGVPPQIVDYVEAAVASVTPQGYEEVLAFLDDAMATDKTLAQLLAERDEAIQAVDGKIDAETLRATEAEEAKVDKVEGESLVNSDFANGIQYIDNPEFVEVKVDSEDKILEAIKADGSKYIGGDLTVNGEIINPGFDAKIDAAIEEMKAEVQETIEEITKDLDVETLSSFSTNENPEYLQVTTDSEDKILEGIKSDGTKEINLPTVINSDLQVLGSLDISGATYSLCQSPEWIKVLVDSQERIIAGVRTDGSVYIGQLEGLDDKLQEMLSQMQAMLDEAKTEIDAKLEVFNSVFNIVNNPEWIQVTTDSEGKILEGITTEGKKKVMVKTSFEGGIEGVASQEEVDELDSRVEALENVNSDIKGKNMGVDGDSITEGNQWSYYAAQRLECNQYNVAVGGASWAYKELLAADGETLITPQSYSDPNFAGFMGERAIWESDTDRQKFVNNNACTHIEKFLALVNNSTYPTPDLFVFAMGVNKDTGYGNSNGTVDEAMSAVSINDTDFVDGNGKSLKYTMCGAMRWCIETIKRTFPSCKIFISLPIQRAQYDVNSEIVYPKVQLIEQMAIQMSCQIINQYLGSGITAAIENDAAPFGPYLADGLHPNIEGRKLMGAYAAKELKNNYYINI